MSLPSSHQFWLYISLLILAGFIGHEYMDAGGDPTVINSAVAVGYTLTGILIYLGIRIAIKVLIAMWKG